MFGLTERGRAGQVSAMPFDLSVVGQTTEPKPFTYAWKDVVLYALGCGAKKDELDYLYEGKGPHVLPTFAVVPTFAPMFDVLSKSGGDFSMVVHGGQKVQLHRPIPHEGTLHTTATCRAIYDLRKFATVVVDTQTKDEAGAVLFGTSWTMIFRDAGGFGGSAPPPRSEHPTPKVPRDRAADFTVEEATSPEQALLYRLSGDTNPLHADPAFAERVGFPQGPILHGLCTYGFVLRHLAKGMLRGNAERVRAFEAQFRRPVWPGDTLVTQGWALDDTKVALAVTVKGTGDAVLGSAWAELTPA